MHVATGRDALPRDPAPHVQRRCKSKNRRSYRCTKSEARIAALLRILAGCAARGGKSLSSDSARARSKKQQKEASRRAAPDARERIPTGAGGVARQTFRNASNFCRACKEVEDENDDDWGSGGRALIPNIAAIVCLKAIDQSGQHCYNTPEHFLTGSNTIGRCEALSDRRIEAGSSASLIVLVLVVVLVLDLWLTPAKQAKRKRRSAVSRKVKLTTMQIMSWPRRLSADR